MGRLLEEAFDRIEPKDEAQRKKLEQMRERMRAISQEAAQEIGKAMEEMKRAQHKPDSSLKQLADERSRIAREATEGMIAAFDEQVELIQRILG